jgi:hypothetical protein
MHDASLYEACPPGTTNWTLRCTEAAEQCVVKLQIIRQTWRIAGMTLQDFTINTGVNKCTVILHCNAYNLTHFVVQIIRPLVSSRTGFLKAAPWTKCRTQTKFTCTIKDVKVKGKLVLVLNLLSKHYDMKTYGRVDIETLVLLASTQVRGERSASSLGRFNPGTRWIGLRFNPGTRWIGLVFNLGYEYPRGYTRTFKW